MKGIYFTVLDQFDSEMLECQRGRLLALEESLVGKQEKNRRRTLRRQRERVTKAIQNLEAKASSPDHLLFSIDIGSDSSMFSSKSDEEWNEMSISQTKMFSMNPKIHVGKGFFWQS